MQPTNCRLIKDFLDYSVSMGDSFLQENMRSPDVDLVGPLCGAMSPYLVSALTQYGCQKGKPLEKAKDYALCIDVIGGLGVAWVLGKLTGRKWEQWIGNYALATTTHLSLVYCKKNTSGLTQFGLQLFLHMAITSCAFYLQYKRNPSLNLGAYCSYGAYSFLTGMLFTLIAGVAMDTVVNVPKDWKDETSSLASLVAFLIAAAVVAKNMDHRRCVA